MNQGSFDPTPLKNLINLKRLYLPMNGLIEDFRFLRGMPKLEQLQTDVSPMLAPGGAFLSKYCPNLESLVLFTLPSPGLESELAKLPKLQRLVIVDMTELSDENLKMSAKRIKTTLGNAVQVSVMSVEAYEANLPEDFEKHRAMIKTRCRERYCQPESSNSENGNSVKSTESSGQKQN